jgi:hypothetical protein
MPLPPTIRRELDVAFSKDSQPVWFRIIKYILLFILFYSLWGTELLWIIITILLVVGTVLHFWFRYKTNGWTKSYGMWKHESERNTKKE